MSGPYLCRMMAPRLPYAAVSDMKRVWESRVLTDDVDELRLRRLVFTTYREQGVVDFVLHEVFGLVRRRHVGCKLICCLEGIVDV